MTDESQIHLRNQLSNKCTGIFSGAASHIYRTHTQLIETPTEPVNCTEELRDLHSLLNCYWRL
jgi:hypothetical protein